MEARQESRPWQCLECGERLTQSEAERIVNGTDRCECGGVDVDLTGPGKEKTMNAADNNNNRPGPKDRIWAAVKIAGPEVARTAAGFIDGHAEDIRSADPEFDDATNFMTKLAEMLNHVADDVEQDEE